MLAGARRSGVEAGRTLHRVGDGDRHVELVVAGLVRVHATAPDGRTLTVRYCRRGALIGILSLYAEPFVMPVTIQAVVATELVTVSPTVLRGLADRDVRVARALPYELSERATAFAAEIGGSAFATVRQRVARHLLDRAAPSQRLEKPAPCAPIREHTAVTALTPDSTGWALHTTDDPLLTRTVIVATGGENVPHTPESTRRLPTRIAQLHSAEYRRPDQLPSGAVLVVGSAQSGYQIAEELLQAGRRVILATSRVGRAPARHRGRDTLELLVESGFFDQTPDDLPDPSVMHAPQPLLAPGGRSASLQTLARAGATLTGRLVAVDGQELCFDDSVAANIAAADAFAARIRALLDESAHPGCAAAAVEPDPADLPVTLDPPTILDARDVGCVIWCTGNRGDFSWLAPSLRDDTGRPRRRGAAGPLPGI